MIINRICLFIIMLSPLLCFSMVKNSFTLREADGSVENDEEINRAAHELICLSQGNINKTCKKRDSESICSPKKRTKEEELNNAENGSRTSGAMSRIKSITVIKNTLRIRLIESHCDNLVKTEIENNI